MSLEGKRLTPQQIEVGKPELPAPWVLSSDCTDTATLRSQLRPYPLDGAERYYVPVTCAATRIADFAMVRERGVWKEDELTARGYGRFDYLERERARLERRLGGKDAALTFFELAPYHLGVLVDLDGEEFAVNLGDGWCKPPPGEPEIGKVYRARDFLRLWAASRPSSSTSTAP